MGLGAAQLLNFNFDIMRLISHIVVWSLEFGHNDQVELMPQIVGSELESLAHEINSYQAGPSFSSTEFG